ncbi:MAG: 8-oxo-dGTP pyrophosphatase MutT (NUDIX family) [Halioglobus sp.]|jgi:8-oxo-dGTP pyrophosphatase MutT (NUDIX family)
MSRDTHEEPVFPSATVVFIRDGEVGLEALLVQRSKAVKHMGGMWVFPGGKVDDSDYPLDRDAYGAAVNAVIREAHEEAGLSISSEQLVYLSHWTTPEGAPKRFSTWFFLAILESGQEVEVDGGEISNYRWVQPSLALAEAADDSEDLQLMPPTYVSLVDIADCQDCRQARGAMGERQAVVYAPRVAVGGEGTCFLYEGDAGYISTDAAAQGSRHRTVVSDGKLRYIRQGCEGLSER